MTLHRREFLRLAAGAAALAASPRFAFAENYPTRPVRLIVGVPPGLGPDIIARLLAQGLSDRLGQQFIVENHPGAGTNLAAEKVARAEPDGYSLVLLTTANAVNATLYEEARVNVVSDFATVASIGDSPFVMVVNPSVPAKSVAEFIAYAQANPGKINMASAGPGTPPHIFGELFKMMAHVDMLHVPYRGNFYQDLLGGRIQVAFGNIVSSIEYIHGGKLRPLGVTTAKRADALPDVPTIAETVPGYEASAWSGVGAPKGTPVDVIALLNRHINSILGDSSFKARLAVDGIAPQAMTPGQFHKFVVDETKKWAEVVHFAGIKRE
jgi:tripartite-type tricarboxylate transporter receptor subunit TctC